MKKFLMLLHMGERPDLYLNLSLFLEHIGVFVYDNREAVFKAHFKRTGITAFVYLISNDEMLDKFLHESDELEHGRVILAESMAEKRDPLKSMISQKGQDIEILCDDNWEKEAEFVLRYLAGSQKEYQYLKELYHVFDKNNLIRAYYCAQYMELGDRAWQPVLNGVMKAVQEFAALAYWRHSAHALYAEAMAMKRVNDICQKIFCYKRDRWAGGSEEQAVYYEYEKIIKCLEEAYMAEPDLRMALIFLADAEERRKENRRRVEIFFMHSNQIPMVYYVSYKWGLFYQRHDDERARDKFRDSIEENPCCYRSQYKMGLIMERIHRFHQAMDCYDKILIVLRRQIEDNYLHPIEYEYAVKSYFRIGYCCKKLNELDKAKACFEEARKLSQRLSDNDFIKEFFSDYIEAPVKAVQRKVSQNPVLAGLEEIERITKGEWV